MVQRNAVEESPFFYHNVNKEIADQGTGTYELRFYAKAKDGEAQLLVLKGEVYLPLMTVTEEWTLYTIPLNETNTIVTEEDLKGLTFTSVSYTHLDVYKRQPLRSALESR